MSRSLDVGIVGAGPAGAFCAERLAKAGHQVCLYDPSHPREKACGGGVTPGVFEHHPELRELRALGRPSHSVRLRGPAGRVLNVPIAQPIDVFSRRVFDSALVDRARKAGARFESARVTNLSLKKEQIELEAGGQRNRHDFVVGADGPSSMVRRALLGHKPGDPCSYATAGFFVDGIEEDELYIEFIADYPGYLWVFPRLDHVSVGVAAPLHAENGQALQRRVLSMLEQRYPGSLDHPRRPYAASIPVAGTKSARRPVLGGPHFALIGDAAALPDAITGEGIQHAIDSAATLASALCEAGPMRAHDLYRERWMASTGKDLARAAQIARWLYSPRGVDLALALGSRSRRVNRVISEMLMVAQPYSTLGRRLLRDALRRF
ncbi:MAG: NAD(P)/FAD-dependent oxidoreductase [bacterium]|nr:NAD(P)/FAD-dependent oxidoreductase [bacterium]